MSYRIYTTKGIVLKKKSSGEQNSLLYILTKDLGLVIASARSTRSAKSKLKGLMEEYSYGDFSLVKGKNGWQLTNVSNAGNFFFEANEYSRKTLAQVSSVLVKMIQGEVEQSDIYETVLNSFSYLSNTEKESVHSVEIVTVLRVMNFLGYVETTDEIKNLTSQLNLDDSLIEYVSRNKIRLVGIINKAIKASQL